LTTAINYFNYYIHLTAFFLRPPG